VTPDEVEAARRAKRRAEERLAALDPLLKQTASAVQVVALNVGLALPLPDPVSQNN